MSDTQPLTLPVDYYELLGLVPYHLFPSNAAPSTPTQRWIPSFGQTPAQSATPTPLYQQSGQTISPEMVDIAAALRSRDIEHDVSLSDGSRTLRLFEIELGRRILRSDKRRARYDEILTMGRSARSGERLRRLRMVQEDARQELAYERGDVLDPQVARNLIHEGNEALRQGRQNEAVELFAWAAQLLPYDVAVHFAYARALLAVEDPLALSGFAIRMVLNHLETVVRLDPYHQQAPAILAFCRGLVARNQDDRRTALSEFQQAVDLNPQIIPAWRGMAAIALQEQRWEMARDACESALRHDPDDERVLLMLAVTYRRMGRYLETRDIADRIAILRGDGWTMERVMHEIA